jgi:hypothetical protein
VQVVEGHTSLIEGQKVAFTETVATDFALNAEN